MVPENLAQSVLELSVEDRLELARRLVESVVAPTPLNDAVTAGIRRIEDIVEGRMSGLTEDEFRAALQ